MFQVVHQLKRLMEVRRSTRKFLLIIYS